MRKTDFNLQWKCYRTGEKDKAFEVTLPHDAMLLDERVENSPAGVNTGWYDARDYTYEKNFYGEEIWKSHRLLLEFEGAYRKASVYMNDEKVAYQEYGYIGFFADVTEQIKIGEMNCLRVEVVNSDQPNSRWYSGTGLYRPVWLHVLPQKHIEPEGIRITTISFETKEIEVQVNTNAAGPVAVEILDGEKVIARKEGMTDGHYVWRTQLENANLWNPESPYLYHCKVIFEEDVCTERFGIRTVSCDAENGFCINGRRVILRGGCIHHDNGVLGACAYEYAEKRKVRILKEAGYNALRSAHNPCSKAMLDACDEQGMLMMEEYVDVWYIHKTKYDYALQVEKNYREDLQKIVARDYNHPSVIMYSTGNEVSETAQERGIRLCGEMTEYLHQLDATRPVTCGINIFFNFLSSMGFGVYSDKKADRAAEDAKKKKAVGSEFFNTLAGMFGSGFMKFGATLYPCDLKTKGAFANMDIAGYNYGINRYKHDLRKYPERMILGSETFCSDAYRFYEMAKKEKRIIGDFVWAAMDYLGEVGIGSWEYADYAPRFDGGKGWLTAGSGRVDLTGKCLSEMSYTQVAFEQKPIGIAVIPVNHTHDKHSPSAWKMTNALESWSFEGCEGQPAKVEVYARGAYVKLYVNGKEAGRKSLKKDCRVIFETVYENGELTAEAYDGNDRLLAKETLRTAGKETVLTAVPEERSIRKKDLCYVRFQYTDKKGTVKPLERGKITIAVKGGTLLGFGSACPYFPEGYRTHTADTYYGENLAVIQPDGSKVIEIQAESKIGSVQCEVKVIE